MGGWLRETRGEKIKLDFEEERGKCHDAKDKATGREERMCEDAGE